MITTTSALSRILGADLSSEDVDNASHLPVILRRREFHCHGQDGVRYLDLWRPDSLLGYSIRGQRSLTKRYLDRNLGAFYPHPAYGRAASLLESLFPGYFALFLDDNRQVGDILFMITGETRETFVPGLDDLSPTSGLFRLLLPFHGELSGETMLCIPRLVCSQFLVLLVKKTLIDVSATGHLSALARASTTVPVHALEQGLAALRSAASLGGFGQVKHVTGLPRPDENSSGEWSERYWSTFATGPWTRNGPYLVHALDSAAYSKVFRAALAQGVILNPSCRGVNILPGKMSEGERAILTKIVASGRPGSGDSRGSGDSPGAPS